MGFLVGRIHAILENLRVGVAEAAEGSLNAIIFLRSIVRPVCQFMRPSRLKPAFSSARRVSRLVPPVRDGNDAQQPRAENECCSRVTSWARKERIRLLA